MAEQKLELKNYDGKLSKEEVLAALENKMQDLWQKRLYNSKLKEKSLNIEDIDQFTLIAFKSEMILELWGSKDDEKFFICDWPIKSASGIVGPKRIEGDRQVPEGFYKITTLNPASKYHLSLALNYPNEQDLAWAKKDGRTNLGKDIYIHGGKTSLGCLAIGDAEIEELFYLVGKQGKEKFNVLIAPWDFRKRNYAPIMHHITWMWELYNPLFNEIKTFGGDKDLTLYDNKEFFMFHDGVDEFRENKQKNDSENKDYTI